MEEADLLKERLQAITDKRKLQEDIARKKREIEEEKLKLQYLKKKALREQWLMDGLSPQSEQDQEAMKLQAHDDEQQTKVLQSNIHRMEKEIEALESQEVTISTNEALILKRLKEIEKTTEDIIKAVNTDVHQESIKYVYSAIPDIPNSYKPLHLKKPSSPQIEADKEQSKQALFAMEINVEKDMKTGKSQVLSTSMVTAEELPQMGVKVYDDGRKSVYAVKTDGQKVQNGVGELSPIDVEELLRKATEKQSKTDVEYHEPVFSSSYNRPSTPKRQDQISPGTSSHQETFKNLLPVQPEVLKCDLTQPQGKMSQASSYIPYPSPSRGVQQPSPQSVWNIRNDVTDHDQTHLVTNSPPGSGQSLKANRAAVQLDDTACHKDPAHSEYSSLNVLNVGMENTDSSEPVTMIFMGYQNVDNEEEDYSALDNDGVIQAELVVINDDDDDNDQDITPSYHPNGCHSKVFQPQMKSKVEQCLTEAKANCRKNDTIPYTTSAHVLGQEAGLSNAWHSPHTYEQGDGKGTEDPCTTALRMRMAKLGKRV